MLVRHTNHAYDHGDLSCSSVVLIYVIQNPDGSFPHQCHSGLVQHGWLVLALWRFGKPRSENPKNPEGTSPLGSSHSKVG